MRSLIEKITNRYTILLVNILLSGVIIFVLYMILLLYTKINPIDTLDEFSDLIDVALQIIGTLIFVYTVVVGVAFISARKKGKREHMYGYLFTLVYCLSWVVLYWLD
jgi:hypothetical protein